MVAACILLAILGLFGLLVVLRGRRLIKVDVSPGRSEDVSTGCKQHFHTWWSWEWWPPGPARNLHWWTCDSETCSTHGDPCERPQGHGF